MSIVFNKKNFEIVKKSVYYHGILLLKESVKNFVYLEK